MIVKYENGEYKAIGEFDFGFGGIFKNDEKGNGNIKIELYEEDYERMKLKPEDTGKIALKIEKFINKVQKTVKKYNQRLKNAYLLDKFESLIYGRQNFWGKINKIPNYEKNKEEYDKKLFEVLQNSFHNLGKAFDLFDIQYDNTKLATILFRSNVEKYLRKTFLFIDFDLLLSAIKPKELIFSDFDFEVNLSNELIDEFSHEFYMNSYNKKLSANYDR